ncbi:ATP-grasp domain-containing protein [Actinoplanes sichuanensis]|uniref:ATP-grasp domain-containing protein n=1 Tax=Actinoplanes sichuanensis TaxID=512349 RepID=A0ABW4AHX3_9ACTN|nr:ATP-grasp domain-containing protein [Actinoplanes sichuanensis]BEL02163.1 ATP-grasp domain-containing protein [Actinoplanes sichuanensis]
MSDSRTVVMVDAYAPTRRLAPVFHKAGYRVVRVQSTPEAPLVYQGAFDLSPYAGNIVHTGDLDATLAAVQDWDPVAVVAGGEVGVEFADLLGELLGLPNNGTALSVARRDKYVQIETLRAAGLRATRQLLVEDAGQLEGWHAGFGGRIVVKPIRSAAGDGVHFCATPEESVAAYRKILGSENIFSHRNDAVVAQEYLTGGEYVVDTVSCDGRHQVTDIWKYEKLTANGITDLTCGVRLLPRHGAVQEALVPYACAVLDALGIRFGAAHLEIKLTPDGPCLVEVGARMAGLDLPGFCQPALGEGQLEWIVDAYVRPRRFAARAGVDYEVRKHVVSAWAVSTREARLKAYPMMGLIEGLESLYDVRPVVSPGGRLRRTVDDLSTPLIVNLMHPVEEIVDRDFGTFRYLDGPSFYELDEDS